jgi:peptide/nickel transport system permease protein
MTRFLAARLLQTVFILFGVSLVAFALIHMIPGNPLDILLPPEAPKTVVDRLRFEFGFDRPLYVQYLSWLSRVLHGDLGTSIFTGREVTLELLRAFGNTLIIALPAAFLGFGLGTILGAWAAFNYRNLTDRMISTFVILGLSIPHFWLAIVLVILFAVVWNILPAAGMGSTGGFPGSWDSVRHLILPVVTLSMIPVGVIGRIVRSTILEILSNDFPTALRAKGLKPRRVIFHVLKNAAPPTLAVMGLQLGYLLGGSIFVETVFNWPGSGQLMNLAIFRRDIPVLQGAVLLLASFFVLINLLVDLTQALIDPRMRR